MEFRMELMLLLCVIPAIVVSISISPNGNSPKVKMLGGMMVDVQKGFLPNNPQFDEPATAESNYERSRKLNYNVNSTKLAINERYRRLIPYMTFYYANDLAAPPSDGTRNVEVEKVRLIEAKEIANQRQPKKIYHSHRNIPRYQGNRLTQYNIASANPTKIYYKDGVPIYQTPNKVTPNYNPLITDLPVYNYESGRIVQKQPSAPFSPVTKRPYLNLYNEELPNIRYYLSEKEQAPKYKLVPYEQTPPVKITNVQASVQIPFEQIQSTYDPILSVKESYNQYPVKTSFDQVPTKEFQHQSPLKVSYVPQPVQTTFEQSPVKESYEQPPVKEFYEQPPVKIAYQTPPVKIVYEQPPVKVTPAPIQLTTPKQPSVKVTYEQKLPQNDDIYEPRKPVIVSVLVPKELYVKPRPVRPYTYDNGNSHQVRKQPAIVSESYYEKRPQTAVSEPVVESGFKPIVSPAHYTTEVPIYTSTLSQVSADSEYLVEKEVVPLVDPTPTPETRPNYYQYVVDQPKKETSPSGISLASLLNSLQVNKSIPKPITRDNVASSIRTLLQYLNSLKAQSNGGVATKPLLSTPKPFVSTKVIKLVSNPEIGETIPEVVDPDLHEEPYLAPVNTPSQHLDEDHVLQNGQRPPSSQQFPLPVTSDEDGGTPGTPGVDYPVLGTIPHTSFNCKTQRYKGFFADTETRCQVWHYCDLNGGQASFLCPNGTIFSQAGLTCDWWFNVRCDSTTQLYVLNESLYKYILPHSPKFPEDYSGPLVDKYLTLKFKEMEEEFKKNKSKNDDKSDSDEEDDEEEENETNPSAETDKRQLSVLSEASVIVETPGTSGKVQRLHDE